MPPEMKRQNAFSTEQDPFKEEISCCICLLSEEWGQWKRITCQCSIIDDYYHAHKFCLNKVKRCRECQTLYIVQKSSITDEIYAYCKFIKGIATAHKKSIMISTSIVLCILVSVDLYRCTTIERFDHNDLPELPENEDILLPVFNFICLKSRPSGFIFNFYFIIVTCIVLFILN